VAANAMDLSNDLAELIFYRLDGVAEVETFGLRGGLKITFKDGTVAYLEVEIRGR
jgi:hypothetical protein